MNRRNKPSRAPAITGKKVRLPRRRAQLELSIPSQLSAVERVCERIRGLLAGRHSQQVRFEVELVARECLNNAILHGNGGLPHRRVSFVMRLGKQRICLRIADQGPGFNWHEARRRSWPGQNNPRGRGLLLVGSCTQRVRFNRKGNQITVWIPTTGEGR